MKKKKFGLLIIGLVCTATLAVGCSSSEDIVTMKGNTITVDEFYEEVKLDQTAQQKLTNMIINEVALAKYGDKVDQKEIDKTFKETKEQYGDTFTDALKSSGMTEESYKESLKAGAAYDLMLEAHMDLTDEDLKAVWATYHPEVEVQLIAVAEEAAAKDIQKKAKDGDDFGKLAESESTDASATEKGTVKFDSTTAATVVPEEVKTAAYALKDNDISDVITVATYDQMGQETTSYYIVKMVKNQEKGNDMKPFEKELKEIATATKKTDQQFVYETIGAEFKEANVKIKDEDLSSIVEQFLPQEETSSTDSSQATTESTK